MPEEPVVPKVEGKIFRTAEKWFKYVPLPTGPINYLEIGVCCGANLISVAQTYAKCAGSVIVAVDPWGNGGSTYAVNLNKEHYDFYIKNLKNFGLTEKVRTNIGTSRIEVPKLANNFFDIIYIDGNHKSNYVLEDAVLSFNKLKIGGYLIFDDYAYPGKECSVKKGVDAFLLAYEDHVSLLAIQDTQVFVKKKLHA